MNHELKKCKKCKDGRVRRDDCHTCKGSGYVLIVHNPDGSKTIKPAQRPAEVV